MNTFKGNIINGRLGVTNATINGSEFHPEHAYDAKDGGDHPYDIYNYNVNGTVTITTIREMDKPNPLPTPPNNPNQPNPNDDKKDSSNDKTDNQERDPYEKLTGLDDNSSNGEYDLSNLSNEDLAQWLAEQLRDAELNTPQSEFDKDNLLACFDSDCIRRNMDPALYAEYEGAANAGTNLTKIYGQINKKLLTKDGKIDMSKFSQRVKNSGAKPDLKDPKTGWRISPDRAGANSHQSDYKLLDKNGKRIATISKDGKILRP